MATAGSGDVLSGMILGLLAQGEPVYESAWKGVYLHGLCGDMAAKKLTAYGMKASHLIDFLPKTLKKYNKRGGGAAGTV
jgi:NAD(P)H-hydrate epimerase